MALWSSKLIARDIIVKPEVSIDLQPDAATVYDLSRYKNNGTITTATWTQLPGGIWGLSFVSTNPDKVTFSSIKAYDLGEEFTLFAWVKPTTLTSTMQIIACEDTAVKGYGFYIAADGSFAMYTRDAGGADTAGSLVGSVTTSRYHYLVVVHTSGDARFWADGIDRTNVATSRNPADPFGNPLYVGVYGNGAANPMNGIIPYYGIRKYAFTAGQIRSNYEKTKHLFGVHD